MTALDDLEAELAAVAAREPAVQAWTARHGDDELRALVAEAAAGGGPLAGWTLGVKDVIDTADLPTGRGSPIYTGRRPSEDAACVALARAAGAVVAGKTTTTEFALFTPTATTNPHNGTRTPGGSSSGSAAAVAAGMVRVAYGTQTVGSVLRPAAFCGVVGFKGSHGAVPMNGVGALALSLDTLGWHTRSVADAAVLQAVLTGAARPGGDPAGGQSGPPRFGLYRSHVWDRAQPELEPLLVAVTDRLRAAGADVIELDPAPHLAPVVDAGAVILAVESALVFAWERAHHADQIHEKILRLLAKGDRTDRAQYHEAQRAVAAARAAHDRWLDDLGVDALLTPSAPGEAVPIDTTGDSIFNATWSTLGVPAIQIPAGTGPLGLPLGVQLTGRRWADAALFAPAAWVEAALAEAAPIEITSG
ncbi:MAG: amidase [Acidimicrobiales bacterium]